MTEMYSTIRGMSRSYIFHNENYNDADLYETIDGIIRTRIMRLEESEMKEYLNLNMTIDGTSYNLRDLIKKHVLFLFSDETEDEVESESDSSDDDPVGP